jgi:hypothetical protein
MANRQRRLKSLDDNKKMITEETISKISEIARLHDEAFNHYQKYDGHAKSSDGAISLVISFGNVWERNADKQVEPKIGLEMYSYVVARDIPAYETYGSRTHWFDSVDQALEVVKEWHSIAMKFSMTDEEMQEMDKIAYDFIDKMAKSGKLKVIEVDNLESKDNI